MTISSIAANSAVTLPPEVASQVALDASLASDSLLPLPDEAAHMDELSNLYALMSEARRTSFDRARGNAEGLRERKQVARDQALSNLRHAEEKAREADDFLGMSGTLGDIAKVATVVAAVGVAVSTAGSGAVFAFAVAGAALSSAAFTQSQFHYLEAVGMDEDIAGYVELGMWVAGAGCSLGAGAASAGQAAEKGAEAAGGWLQQAGGYASSGAGIVGGTSAAAAGYSEIRRGLAQEESDQATTDAVVSRTKADRADRMLRFLLDTLTDSEKSDERALGHVRSAIEAKSGALLMASRRV